MRQEPLPPGVAGERRVVALRGLLSYVIGAIQLEHLGALPGPGTVAITELPLAEFPHMAETARDARNVGAVQEFLGGLAPLLDGLGDLGAWPLSAGGLKAHGAPDGTRRPCRRRSSRGRP
ncbi:hypothetical protein ACFCYB_01270 [Streptomyces sp. NPDC056309]|uniref:hypothetical protein n=1 Tax=unclassified Streptomyces TaxID=2593676 RepID=UPI0035DAB030